MPNRVPLLLFFSSYVKLQEAFAAERNAAGSWTLIGYTEPTSNNFNYKGAITTETVELSSLSDTKGWRAQNKVALNDCALTSCYWDIQLNNGTKGGQIAYSACQTNNAAPLTPNFTAIGGTGSTCSVSTSW